MKRTLVALVVVLSLSTASPAGAAALSIGDAAPPLKITEWVKGDPVDLAAVRGKRIVVMEIWATWCGPCLSSIPHLTELQHRFGSKGVTVVGVTSRDENNTLEQVRSFVADRGERMDFTVGFDREGITERTYMEQTGQQGIPTAFVIDRQGRLAWIGHPLFGLQEALAEMVAGTYDMQLARKVFERSNQLNQAMMSGRFDEALRHAEQIIRLKPDHAVGWETRLFLLTGPLGQPEQALAAGEEALRVLGDRAELLASVARILLAGDSERYHGLATRLVTRAVELAPREGAVRRVQFSLLIAQGREKEALRVAEQSIDLLRGTPAALTELAGTLASPQPDSPRNDLALRAIELAIAAEPAEPAHLESKFYLLAAFQSDRSAAEAAGRLFIDQAGSDAAALNSFAWQLLTDPALGGRYHRLALLAAERANRSSSGRNWEVLDTLALAKFETGAVAEAVELQKQAIARCDNPQALPSLKQALARFQAEER